jgi:hypothetical protein
MREYGIPKVLTWRWTPFAALVLGSVSFVGFAMLVIPDHIGHADGESNATTLRLGNAFVPSQPGSTPRSNWSSSDDGSSAGPTPSPVTQVATRGPDAFPKRGFSPPLERADTPAPAPPPPPDLMPPPVPAAPPPPPEAAPPPPAPPPPGPDRPEPPPAPPQADQPAPPDSLPPTSQ